MTHIEQMIKDMCPHGVEYKKLGEVADIRTGKGITQSDAAEGGVYPIISGGIGPMGYYHVKNRDANTITVSRVGANAGFVNYITEDFYLNDKCFSVIPNTKHTSLFNTKFVYYYLKHIENTIREMQSEGGVPTINTQKVGSLEIPIPPLEIQKKIVECLDKFSALAAELQAELQKRRTQYEFYRTRLLTPPPTESNSADKFDDCNWRWITLGEVATYTRGITYNKQDELHTPDENGIKVLRANNITLSSNSLNFGDVKIISPQVKVKPNLFLRKNDIFICAGSGSKDHIGKVAYIENDMDYTFGGFMGVVRTLDGLNSKYLYYILTSKLFKEYLVGALNSTTINNLNNTIMNDFRFPMPSIEEQARIVAILDKFEALTTSLSDGIPAEQAAQQKRYEYYRDLLLTFDRKAV